ncbi:ribosome maturation factor RimP [Aquabacterium sp. CECT 9606]|uniref:ribosome maturation factor RimP n=1 Tax=Aquabacterium sp. CECT 9606 TaxID=2845822 RepID=UPI001E34CC81|nr:ribosome maturation factor RimP [Aquabacterium sp. CECT 9606]CAH0355755.1 Ribosome maturation factor RimP [Aquabacterium sp. CECT 9606]
MSLVKAVESTVTGLGYELVECERTPQGLLRVYIDRLPDGVYDLPGEYVTVEDCEKVNRQLQYALEVVNVDYSRLEVSSPGLDRPLTTPAHFERFAGVEVEVSLKVPFQGRKNYRGVLEAVEVPEGEAAPEGGSWQLVFKVGEGKNAVEQALGFTLDEVRAARLVPVVDFKGRGRRVATPEAGEVAVDEAQDLGGQKK